MPELTNKDYRRYKQSIVDIGKANNQTGYLYDFYTDNDNTSHFLKTKCYFAWNDQVNDLFKRKSVDDDFVHVIFKYKDDLIDSTYHINKVNVAGELFLLEENDELARQSIMEMLNRRRLEMLNRMSTLVFTPLETSKDNITKE